ncbi:MAG: hypothetical protein Q7T26_09750 [Dehalococcoidia bacterium]|nr:hypothetical protein [Dehalococcoidia bacterium]
MAQTLATTCQATADEKTLIGTLSETIAQGGSFVLRKRLASAHGGTQGAALAGELERRERPLGKR